MENTCDSTTVHSINSNEAKNNLYLLTSEDLVEEDLDMVGAEMLRADDDLVQVALKQLRDHVSVRMLVKEFMNNHRILTEIKPYRRNEPLDYHGWFSHSVIYTILYDSR